MSWTDIITQILVAHAQQDDDRHKAVMDGLTNIKDILMALTPEVQALHDAVVAQGIAITDATTEIPLLEASIEALKAQLAALNAGSPINPADLAAIVEATNTISASVTTIKNVMPTPIAAPVIDAAAAASA